MLRGPIGRNIDVQDRRLHQCRAEIDARRSERHVIGRQEILVRIGEVVAYRLECGDSCEQPTFYQRLDDEPVTFLPQDGLIASELELTWDTQKLIPTLTGQ